LELAYGKGQFNEEWQTDQNKPILKSQLVLGQFTKVPFYVPGGNSIGPVIYKSEFTKFSFVLDRPDNLDVAVIFVNQDIALTMDMFEVLTGPSLEYDPTIFARLQVGSHVTVAANFLGHDLIQKETTIEAIPPENPSILHIVNWQEGTAIQPGFSGAPVYVRENGNASLVGYIVGGDSLTGSVYVLRFDAALTHLATHFPMQWKFARLNEHEEWNILPNGQRFYQLN
jgi:hypothetical protein